MKPLKILLGNNTLSLLAGSETWTYTLALQLKKMGHNVACYSPDLGIIAEKLMEEGVPCYNNVAEESTRPFSYVLEERQDHNYDVIISNHNHIVEYLRSVFPKTPIISTIHGVIHFDTNGKKAPEHPALESGVNQFVAVSEEVRDKLKADYGIDAEIIRNAFDMNKYGMIESPEGKEMRFMINTNYNDSSDPEIMAVREAGKLMGAKVAAVGQNFSQSFDLTRAITDSTVIFGMGRSVLEGMAAGRLAIVHGRWGTGGPITPETVEELRKRNFSGRGSELATPEEIVEMVKKHFNTETLEWSRKYILKDHNILKAAEEYVRIARELLGHSFVRPPAAFNQAVDPEARPFRLAKS